MVSLNSKNLLRLLSFVSLVAFASVAVASESPEENVHCIWNAGQEIYRLMDRHEPKVMKAYEGRVQIAAEMDSFDDASGVSVWSSCGYEKYDTEAGAITKHYSVRLNRACKVIPKSETIQPRNTCPDSL